MVEYQNFSELLYELGERMKKLSTWLWIQLGAILFLFLPILFNFVVISGGYTNELPIFSLFFLLIFGVGGISIVTLVFQIQFMITINKMATSSKDETLEKIFYFQIGGLIAPVVGLGIVTIILNILTFVELKEWFSKVADTNGHPRLVSLEDPIDLIKLGHILTFIGVGVFIIPLGYRRAGEEIMHEYSRTQFNWIQTYPGMRIYPKSNTYGKSQPNNTNTSFTPSSHTTGQSPKFCTTCGASVPNPTAQFCELCGEKL